MALPAHIVKLSHSNCLTWQCPTCRRTLAELYEGRVVVKAGDRLITFPAKADVQQSCSRCGSVSRIVDPDRVA